MLVYSLHSKRCIDVTDTQYSFLEKVSQTNGDILKAVSETLLTNEVLESWKQDPNFWPMVESLASQIARARVLNLAFIKDQLISTIEGVKQPSKIQMAAINASIKLLHTGNAGVRSAKVEITPDTFSVSFEEGVINSNPDADPVGPVAPGSEQP